MCIRVASCPCGCSAKLRAMPAPRTRPWAARVKLTIASPHASSYSHQHDSSESGSVSSSVTSKEGLIPVCDERSGHGWIMGDQLSKGSDRNDKRETRSPYHQSQIHRPNSDHDEVRLIRSIFLNTVPVSEQIHDCILSGGHHRDRMFQLKKCDHFDSAASRNNFC